MITKFKQFEKLNIINFPEHLSKDKYLEGIIRDLGYNTEEIEYLGSGAFGFAYKVEDKVIKITQDPDEYTNANKLRKKFTKYIITYYDTRKIYVGGAFFNYVLVMDYVEPINTNLVNIYRDILDIFKMYLYKTKDDIPTKTSIEDFSNEYIESDTFKIYEKPKLDKYDISIAKFKEILKSLKNISDECKKYNIPTRDLHCGNIGYDSNGTLRFYDVGFDTYLSPKKELKPLIY